MNNTKHDLSQSPPLYESLQYNDIDDEKSDDSNSDCDGKNCKYNKKCCLSGDKNIKNKYYSIDVIQYEKSKYHKITLREQQSKFIKNNEIAQMVPTSKYRFSNLKLWEANRLLYVMLSKQNYLNKKNSYIDNESAMELYNTKNIINYVNHNYDELIKKERLPATITLFKENFYFFKQNIKTKLKMEKEFIEANLNNDTLTGYTPFFSITSNYKIIKSLYDYCNYYLANSEDYDENTLIKYLTIIYNSHK